MKGSVLVVPILVFPVIVILLLSLLQYHVVDYGAIAKQVAAERCNPANYSVVSDGENFRVKCLGSIGFIEYKTIDEAREAIDFSIKYSRREYRANYNSEWRTVPDPTPR